VPELAGLAPGTYQQHEKRFILEKADLDSDLKVDGATGSSGIGERGRGSSSAGLLDRPSAPPHARVSRPPSPQPEPATELLTPRSLPPGDVIFEAQLKKKKEGKSWKKRHTQIVTSREEGVRLVYWTKKGPTKHQSGGAGKLKGVLSLKNSVVDHDYSNDKIFEVQTESGVQFFFEADTPFERNKWLVALSELDGVEEVDYTDLLNSIAQMKHSHPDNLAVKNFDPKAFNMMHEDQKKRLLAIVKSGTDNPTSSVGCYAMEGTDYDTYEKFFSPVISEYHDLKKKKKHVSDWKLPANEALDFSKISMPEFIPDGGLSMRVRVGRNLEGFPLPGAMTQFQRQELEDKMTAVFDILAKDPAYGGKYCSLTPSHKDNIDLTAYQQLVDDHIMFKNMDDDPYLASAGISGDWPYGRGCFISADKGFIVWVGEEDHLRIMCMKIGTNLADVFTRLEGALKKIEAVQGISFQKTSNYGFATSCPTNLGTGMRASVMLPCPALTKVSV